MIARLSYTEKKNIFLVFIGLSILLGGIAVAVDFLPLFGLSFLILYAFVCVNNPKLIFGLFFFLLPFSIEIELPGGLGTDLPSEPMMLSLLGIFILFLAKDKDYIIKIPKGFITWILLFHIGVILLTAIFSSDVIISFKYLVAKLWYVFPFYFLPLILFAEGKDYRYIFKGLMITIFSAVVYVLYRHSGYGFSFEKVNKAVTPIFRNHVNYASILALVLPYFWFLFRTSKSIFKWWYLPLILFFGIATYLSYTRAAFVAVIIAIAASYVIRFRLTTIAVIVSFAGLAVLTTFMISNNNFMDFTPDYEKTITHENYDNLIEATYKMQDVSTMERVYRWVAGFYMISEKPIIGYGPGSFYSQYKSHTVAGFETYVSDNPERSGIHNYYLMIFVEQGIIGFLVFLLLTILPLILGTQTYAKIKNQTDKQLLLAAMLSLIIIDALLLINDLIEADKVGPFYFLNLAIVAMLVFKYKSVNKNQIINADNEK